MAEGDTIEEGVLEQLVQKLTPCIERGDLDACVEEAARLADEVGISADELLGLAAQMFNPEKYEFAYVLALGAVDGLDSSEKAATYSIAGMAAQSLGNASKAETQYLKAIKADPKLATAHSSYAILLEKLNRTDEAEFHHREAIKNDPYDATALYNYAILLEELNRTDEAEYHYHEAIKADPKLAVAHLNYAILLKGLNRMDEAEFHYREAIKADSKLAVAPYNYAILLKELHRIDEAESHYREAIKADPTNAAAHLNYAILLKELNRTSEAEIHYREAIKADSNDAAAHNNYANLLRERGKISKAKSEVQRALQIAKDDSSSQDILPYAHGTLGDIHADEDNYEYAEREYQKALEKSDSMDNSSISEIHNDLGWVYAQMEKSDKAEKEFKKARVLDPMNIKAKRNLLELARIRRERKSDDMSVIQIFLGGVLLFLLGVAYAMFFISMLSEAFFVAQTTSILIFIFVLFNIISKARVGTNGLAIEGSTGHMYMLDKPSIEDSKSKIEHSQLSITTPHPPSH